MKYIIVLADGMADCPDFGPTPMMSANTPNMDSLAKAGRMGLCRTVLLGEVPGSDVANLAILGYEPSKYLRGRSFLEGLARDIVPNVGEMTLRANLVSLSEGKNFAERRLLDYAAGEIEPKAAAELFALLAEELDDEKNRLFAANGFRGILCTEDLGACEFVPAHDMMGELLGKNLPKGAGSEVFVAYMEKAAEILAEAPYNRRRRELGLLEANGLWLWGAGRPMNLPDFGEKYGLSAAMVAGADLLKGIAKAAKIELLELATATGGIVTDFGGKGRVAAEYLLGGGDFVFVHIEAPDEAGHKGDRAAKIAAIERIDSETLPPILHTLRAHNEDFRLIVMPDHATPLHLKTHTSDPVPFLLYESQKNEGDFVGRFDELGAASGSLGEIAAAELLPLLFWGDK